MKKTLIILVLLLVGVSGNAYSKVIKLYCEQTYWSKTNKAGTIEDPTKWKPNTVLIDTDNLILRTNERTYNYLKITNQSYSIRVDDPTIIPTHVITIEINRYTGFMETMFDLVGTIFTSHFNCLLKEQLF